MSRFDVQWRLLAPGIWTLDQPFEMPGRMQIGTRSTLVRLADQSLWLHSPGPAVRQSAEWLRQQGEVAHIVAPNAFHHLFMPEVAELFPAATPWGPRALQRKQPRLQLSLLGAETPPAWQPGLTAHAVQGLKLRETVFFHADSQTLIVTDLLFHLFPKDLPTRILTTLMGTRNRLACSRLVRLALEDRQQLQASLEQILSWPFERVLMAHGEILESADATDKVKAAMAWLRA
ncbi:MAG: DUF4336 domain-containing protein [Candidatus Sericytochromatia bacterium]|nr:DUF4336 domain-containing protein [Candidatus Sericytochromatia bacterium]